MGGRRTLGVGLVCGCCELLMNLVRRGRRREKEGESVCVEDNG